MGVEQRAYRLVLGQRGDGVRPDPWMDGAGLGRQPVEPVAAVGGGELERLGARELVRYRLGPGRVARGRHGWNGKCVECGGK